MLPNKVYEKLGKVSASRCSRPSNPRLASLPYATVNLKIAKLRKKQLDPPGLYPARTIDIEKEIEKNGRLSLQLFYC